MAGKKKRYRGSCVVYTWDRPVGRIKSELGITLYKNQHFCDTDRTKIPKYRYKVTFEEI